MTHSSSQSPLLPTQQNSTSNDYAVLEPLPPSYHDGRVKYYAIWTWRLVIFSITGSSSLRLCNLILQKLFNLTIDSVGFIVYALIVSVMELVLVYPVILFVLGTILGQRRFFGRMVYKGWGTRVLPLSVQKRWIQSGWI